MRGNEKKGGGGAVRERGDTSSGGRKEATHYSRRHRHRRQHQPRQGQQQKQPQQRHRSQPSTPRMLQTPPEAHRHVALCWPSWRSYRDPKAPTMDLGPHLRRASTHLASLGFHVHNAGARTLRVDGRRAARCVEGGEEEEGYYEKITKGLTPLQGDQPSVQRGSRVASGAISVSSRRGANTSFFILSARSPKAWYARWRGGGPISSMVPQAARVRGGAAGA